MLSIVEFFSVDFRPVCNFHGPCLYQQVYQLRLVEVCAYLGCQIFEVQPGRGLASWMQLDGLRSFCGQSWNKSTNFSLDLANFDFQLPLFSSKKKTKKNLQNIFQPSPPAGSRSPPGLPGGLGLRARLSHRFGELHPQRAAEPAAGGRLPRGGLPDDSTTHSTTTPQHIHKKEHKEHNKQQSKNHL